MRTNSKISLCFLDGSVVKNPPTNAGDAASVPEWERSFGERNGNALQYSCFRNYMKGGAWWATVHRVTKESNMN